MIKKILFGIFRATLYTVVLIAAFCGFGLIVSYNSAFADQDSLMAKWQNAMYYDCQSKFATSLEAGGDSSKVINSVLASGNYSVFENLPSFDYTGQGSSLSCGDVVGNRVSGIGSVTWGDIDTAESLLKEIGYKVTNDDINFTIGATLTTETCGGVSGTDCKTSEPSKVESATIRVRYDYDQKAYIYSRSGWDNFWADISISLDSDEHTMTVSVGGNSHTEPLVSPEIFVENLKQGRLVNGNWCVEHDDSHSQYTIRTVKKCYTFTVSDLVKAGASSYDFPTSDGYAIADKLSSPKLSKSDLTNTERYNLYMHYLVKAITASKNGFVAHPDSAANLTPVQYKKSDGTPGTCWANLNSARTDRLYTLKLTGTGSNTYPFITTITLDEIVKWFNGVNIYELGDDAVNYCDESEAPSPGEPEPGEPGEGGGTTDTEEDFCDKAIEQNTNGEGIGAMQWVLCPSLTNTTYTADWIDRITEDWLSVKTDRYSVGSPTYKVWENIRSVANVIMTLFLLVIIFSQLTGYGIDNYGIKKMLPRLITMAIIVNLSFYVCEIVIDLSNILGVGLRDMFANAGVAMAGDNITGAHGFVSTTVTGLLGVGATGGGAAVSASLTAVGLGVGGWVAVVIGLVVLVLVVIVAVAILYIMLGVRDIIILFCIIISPLAFAAFILPNTQNLFKKWWELFKAAIIIFPICGAISGISFTLKQMKFEDQGVAEQMILMVLPYLGFFLLPMLIKNAIAALGKIGGALSAMGTTVRNGGRAIGQGAMRTVQNTEAYKNRQAEAARNRTLASANRAIERLGGKDNLTEAQTRRLARAHETKRKLGLEDQAARTVLTEREYSDKSQIGIVNDWEAAFRAGDIDKMNSLTDVITSKYGPGGASDMADRLAGMDDIFNNGNMSRSFEAFQTNMLQNKSLATNMQNKASDAYQMISGGGFGKDGKRHNLKWHAANNGMATQIKDWAPASGATLRRAAANGGLTADMAKQLLSSTDPAIQSGLLSDTEKRQTLEALAGGYSGDWKDSDAIANAAANYTYQSEMDQLHGQAMEEMRAEMAQRSRDEVEQRKADALESINNKINGGGDNN